jgi:hypothetical protein
MCLGQLDIRKNSPKVVPSMPPKGKSKIDGNDKAPSSQEESVSCSDNHIRICDLIDDLRPIVGDEGVTALPSSWVVVYRLVDHLLTKHFSNSSLDTDDLKNQLEQNDEFSRLDWKKFYDQSDQLDDEYARRKELAGDHVQKIKQVEEWYSRSKQHANTFEAKLMGANELPPPEKSAPSVRLL